MSRRGNPALRGLLDQVLYQLVAGRRHGHQDRLTAVGMCHVHPVQHDTPLVAGAGDAGRIVRWRDLPGANGDRRAQGGPRRRAAVLPAAHGAVRRRKHRQMPGSVSRVTVVRVSADIDGAPDHPRHSCPARAHRSYPYQCGPRPSLGRPPQHLPPVAHQRLQVCGGIRIQVPVVRGCDGGVIGTHSLRPSNPHPATDGNGRERQVDRRRAEAGVRVW